jgi:hypothetical protein
LQILQWELPQPRILAEALPTTATLVFMELHSDLAEVDLEQILEQAALAGRHPPERRMSIARRRAAVAAQAVRAERLALLAPLAAMTR